MAVESFTTNVENVRQDNPEWVKEKIRTELSSLQKDMFYTVKDGKVECDMPTVKSYLESIKDLEWGVLKEKGSAWAMAVQIALESIKDENGNPKYDVGIIDGQFGPNTRRAVRKFQEDCGFTGKDLDGYAGKMTIGKLLEVLGGVVKGSGDKSVEGSGDKSVEGSGDKSVEGSGDKSVEGSGDKPVEGSGDKPVEGSGDKLVEGYNEGENKEPLSKDKYDALIEATRPILKKLGLYYYTNGGYYSPSINPEFTVSKYANDRYIVKTFNFRDFMEGNNFQAEKLENTLRTEMAKAAEESKLESKEQSMAFTFLNSIRGKKYSLEDLGLNDETNDIGLLTLLNQFNKQMVRIDGGVGSTFYNYQTKKFRIELDRSGLNSKKPWTAWEVSREEFKDNEGKYNEDVFKQKLGQRIRDIAKEYYAD